MKARIAVPLLLFLLLPAGVVRADDSAELALCQGRWEVVELIEDGRVIERENIRQWLPSGGRVEIVENAIVFRSPHDGRKHAKTFAIEPTTYPKQLVIRNRDRVEAWGIYQLDRGRLVICMANPQEAQRPTDFSAPRGSRRIMMVLARSSAPSVASAEGPVAELPPLSEPSLTQTNSFFPTSLPELPALEPAPTQSPPAPNGPRPVGISGEVFTDAQVRQMLKGSWKFVDDQGAMIMTVLPDGTFRSERRMDEIRRFQQVFAPTPISSGTWAVQNGQLTFRVLTSSLPNKAGYSHSVFVRSISDRDVIFVDGLGRVGSATRVN